MKENITFVVLYLPCVPVVSGGFPLLKLRQTVESFLVLILGNLTTLPWHNSLMYIIETREAFLM